MRRVWVTSRQTAVTSCCGTTARAPAAGHSVSARAQRLGSDQASAECWVLRWPWLQAVSGLPSLRQRQQLGRYVFNQFSLTPTGAGTAAHDRPADRDWASRVLDPSGRANWKDRTYELSTDGQRLLIPHGWAKGRPPRVYVHDLQQGWTRPITPEGVTGPAVLSADGRLVATNEAATLVVYSVDSGERRELPGGKESALPARWSADARSLLLVEQLGLDGARRSPHDRDRLARSRSGKSVCPIQRASRSSISGFRTMARSTSIPAAGGFPISSSSRASSS